MSRTPILALLALVPAAALAQGPRALEAARAAGAQQQAGTERHQAAADAQVAEPAPAGEPAGADPGAKDGSIDLTAAASKLEGDTPDAADANPPEGTAKAKNDKGGVPPPDTYTVKPGDTLWDLSGRFLNNPWYWPKVWSYNPEITNPHWIEPGNVIRFYPSSEEAPARVEPLAKATDAAPAEAPADEPLPETPRELDDLTRGSITRPEQLGDDDAVAVVGPYKIGYVAPKGIQFRHDSFVTKRELDESGVISAAFEERTMLSTLDKAYARFREPAQVKPGATFVIYKTTGTISHPVTHALFGYKSTILGAAKVIAVDDKAVSLVITSAFEPIERGALLGPWTDPFKKNIARRPNQREVNGVIVAAQTELVTEIGEHHMVFVDKGKSDGVEEGNVFTVLRSGDPSEKAPGHIENDPSLPTEEVGNLLVVDVKEQASAAMVVRSLRELYVGDQVQMRSAAPRAGAGGN